MDDVSWGALALALTLCGGMWTWYAYRHRGLPSAMRGAGLTLLPIALYLTHTLKLVGRIGTEIGDWATGFVWNPFVWVGLALGVVAFVLIGVSARVPGDKRAVGKTEGGPAAVGAAKRKQVAAPVDDDLADIADILRKHGIS